VGVVVVGVGVGVVVVGVGVAVWVGVEVVVAVAGPVAAWPCVVAAEVCVAVEVPVVDSPGLEVPVAVPVVVAVPAGEETSGALDDGGPVHAETVAKTRTITVAQLTTDRCAFMNPPSMPSMRRRHPEIINAASRNTAHSGRS
jgi:hypothetical protein